MVESVAVLGAGSWGTALAMQLARSDLQVKLWGHDPAHMQRLIDSRENRKYLPGYTLAPNIEPIVSLQAAIADCRFLLVAIPSKGFRALLQTLKPMLADDTVLFWASKGFEIDTGLLLHEVVDQELPGYRYGIISGPTFASEVARGLPAAIACAGNHQPTTAAFAELLHGHHFRAYISTDIIGVELGGALKNVLAIAVGVADGLGFGANTRAALMTRGNAEMQRLAAFRGADPTTLSGLSGFGDLVLTCTSEHSRNYRLGLSIGSGSDFDGTITVEGAATARAVAVYAQNNALDLPIAETVAALVEKRLDIHGATTALLSRSLKEE